MNKRKAEDSSVSSSSKRSKSDASQQICIETGGKSHSSDELLASVGSNVKDATNGKLEKCQKQTCSESKLYDDLNKMKSYLEELKGKEPAKYFKEWHDHRKQTIEEIGNLKDSIISVFLEFGGGVTASCKAVVVLSDALEAITEMEGSRTAGKFFSWEGSAAKIVTGLVELFVNKVPKDKIKRLLQRDRELTETLEVWMQSSREVDSISKRLFQCEIETADSITFTKIMQEISQSLKLPTDEQVKLQDGERVLKSGEMEGIEGLASEVSEKVDNFLKDILKNPESLQLLREICNIFQETPTIFECAKVGTRVHLKTHKLANSTPYLDLLQPAAVFCINTVLQHYGLVAIKFAVDLVDTIFEIKGVMEPKYSQALDGIISAMRSEIDELTEEMNCYCPPLTVGLLGYPLIA